jgi:NAD+ synthase (glutamine-hydrolysing)
MRIALVQQNYHIGHFEKNTQKILDAIQQARLEGADLVVFTELCICGYPPRDFLEFTDFINRSYASIESIARDTNGIGVIIGAPVVNPEKEGKDLYNAALLLEDGKISGSAYKSLLPTYDVFDEYRYFEPSVQWNVLTFRGKRIALTICEDIWNLGDNPLYRVCPMDKLMPQHPDLIINISASPFDYDHAEDRKEVIRANVLKYGLPLIYCNTVGAQTEIVFDGGSMAMNREGQLIRELAYFREDFSILEWDELVGSISESEKKSKPVFDKDMRVSRVTDPEKIVSYLTDEKNIGEIHDALLVGIRDYFSKMGFSRAIVGSSGGIDSAVVLALACEALGPENVTALLMPSAFSSLHSVEDAELLSKELGNPYEVVPIKEAYATLLSSLQPIFGDRPFGVAEENLQSRIRGNLLMGVANKFGYILLNTSNKSELATGYGTLYGDMAGGLSVLGDVYKIQVYALARHINRSRQIIPASIIEKAPSAELRPHQKDSDSLPEYPLLDKILYQYIERRKGPREIIALGMDASTVEFVVKLVNSNEYKRNQFCPIIRVSTKAFGVGRRLPIVAKYLS